MTKTNLNFVIGLYTALFITSFFVIRQVSAEEEILIDEDTRAYCSWASNHWADNRTMACDNAYDVSDTSDLIPIGIDPWMTWRNKLDFDTSSLTGTVATATLVLYFDYHQSGSKTGGSYIVPDISELPLTWTDFASLTYTDYGHVEWETVEDAYDYTVGEEDRIEIPLSTAGVNAINVGGITSFYLIHWDDYNAEPHATANYSINNAYSLDQDSTYAPRLLVTMEEEEEEPIPEPTGEKVYDLVQAQYSGAPTRGVLFQVIEPTQTQISGVELYTATPGRNYQNVKLCQGIPTTATIPSKYPNCGSDILLSSAQCTTDSGWFTCNFSTTITLDLAEDYYLLTYQNYDTSNTNYAFYKTSNVMAGDLFGMQKDGSSVYAYSNDLTLKTFYYTQPIAPEYDEFQKLNFAPYYQCSPNMSCVISYTYNQDYFSSTSTIYIYNASSTLISTDTIIDEAPQNMNLKSGGNSYFIYNTNASTSIITLYAMATDITGTTTEPYIIKIVQASTQFLDILGNRIEQQALDNSSVMLSLTGTTTHALVCTPEEWLSGDWWVVSKCNILKSIFDVGDLLSRIGSQIMTKAYVAVSNVFPFNLPIGFSNSWLDARDKPLPANLSFIGNYVDSSGNLSFAVPATMAETETTVPVITSTSFDDSPETKSFFDFTFVLSSYVMYGLFIFNMYILGVSLYSSLYHNED